MKPGYVFGGERVYVARAVVGAWSRVNVELKLSWWGVSAGNAGVGWFEPSQTNVQGGVGVVGVNALEVHACRYVLVTSIMVELPTEINRTKLGTCQALTRNGTNAKRPRNERNETN